jgi:outer membrane protein TolC
MWVKVAIEKYKLGSISQIMLQEAELSFRDAQTRLVNSKYDTKLSEIELMRINGELVK